MEAGCGVDLEEGGVLGLLRLLGVGGVAATTAAAVVALGGHVFLLDYFSLRELRISVCFGFCAGK